MPEPETGTQSEPSILLELCANQQRLIELLEKKNDLLTSELTTTRKLLFHVAIENDTLRLLVCPVN